MINQAVRNYRLIKSSRYDAATNMAIDEAILEAHLDALVPPTLRLYQFSPPAVSLGYAQKVDNELIVKIKEKGFDIVRRPTGGRAVLHFEDLTYAFICSSKGAAIEDYILVSESVITAYKQICQGLILALRSLNIEVVLGKSQTNYRDKKDCFLATTIGDLQFQGNKLVGSAQLRRRHGVLQHGSIILNQPQALMQEILGNNGDNQTANPNHIVRNNTHHANLNDISPQIYSIDDLEQKIISGFAEAFNCQFESAALTTKEQNFVDTLLTKNQYSVKVQF